MPHEGEDTPAPRIVPFLSYEDVGAAMAWLRDAFGFEERFRITEPDGAVTHGDMQLEGGVIFLGPGGPNYEGPRRHAETCAASARWRDTPYVIDGVYAMVADVDAHHRRAVAAGAKVLSDPQDTDHGERIYRVEDVDGHRWMFATPL
jgi:PhnB protein